MTWETFQVLLVVGYWAWPRIRAWITPDPPPPANPVAGDLVDLARCVQIENGFENFAHMCTVVFFKPAHQELQFEYLFAIP